MEEYLFNFSQPQLLNLEVELMVEKFDASDFSNFSSTQVKQSFLSVQYSKVLFFCHIPTASQICIEHHHRI